MIAARRLGRYELGEIIGTGGVAEVVRADVVGAGEFRKPVVIKRVRPELRDDAAVREAFVREAMLAQRLSHGNVAQVLDLGDDDGTPYLVLEFVDGCTLQRLLDDAAGAPLPLAVALHVAEHVAAALHYVHHVRGDDGTPLGLVHRDVTPNNVLLGRDGVVKLTDFGIARVQAMGSDTLPGFIKGTARYLAPEQAAGRPVDARADIYALGLVLRRMLVGDGELVGLDAELAAIVEAATEPAMRDRLGSAELLLTRLQHFRAAAGLGNGVAELAALVERTRGQRAKPVVSLDRALADPLAARTRQVARAPVEPRRARWHYGVGVAVVLAAVALWWLPVQPQPRKASEDASRPEHASPAAPAQAEPPTAPEPRPPAPTPTVPKPTPVLTPTPSPTPAPALRPPARGRLLVNLVPYAEVTLDGAPLGTTPVDESVRAGKHTLGLYNPDSTRRKSIRIEIEPGQTLNVSDW